MITKPTLLIDKNRCKANIRSMAEKAKMNGCVFRPHFKTHQSIEVGRWFKDLGIKQITVSSLEMAEFFSAEWDDITVAFPVNILEINTIDKLAKKIKLNLLVESVESAQFLVQHVNHPLGYFIKIDVGAKRTGLNEHQTEEIDAILTESQGNERLHFQGFLTHAGHAYHCRSIEEIELIHNRSVQILSKLKKQYIQAHPDLIISTGDTPCCSLLEDFSAVDEMRPGNFVYYDLVQCQIGSCNPDQIAVALACPIVAKHRERRELIIYGGGVHFSKERLIDDDLGVIYGKVVQRTAHSWGDFIPGMCLKSLSQEHGIVSLPEDKFEEYEIGDILIILPVHSCMMVNLMRHRPPLILPA